MYLSNFFFTVLKTLILYSHRLASFQTTTHFDQGSDNIEFFNFLSTVDCDISPSYYVKLHHANCFVGFNAESLGMDELFNLFCIQTSSLRRPVETTIASSSIHEMLFYHVFYANGQPTRPPLKHVTLHQIFFFTFVVWRMC